MKTIKRKIKGGRTVTMKQVKKSGFGMYRIISNKKA